MAHMNSEAITHAIELMTEMFPFTSFVPDRDGTILYAMHSVADPHDSSAFISLAYYPDSDSAIIAYCEGGHYNNYKIHLPSHVTDEQSLLDYAIYLREGGESLNPGE